MNEDNIHDIIKSYPSDIAASKLASMFEGRYREMACLDDFWIMMRDAVMQCGGHPKIVEEFADRPLKDAVELLAQNGIRMVYLEDKHISKLNKTL
jgi:hypothetical protein